MHFKKSGGWRNSYPGVVGIKIVLILLQVFLCLLKVKHLNLVWEMVAVTVQDFRQIGGFVNCTGETHQLAQLPLVMYHWEPKISMESPVGR